MPSPRAAVEPAVVRSLLSRLLRTDVDLEAFCIDHFPSVAGRFGANQDRIAKTNILLQTVEHDELLLKLRQRFPHELARFLEMGGDTSERAISGPKHRWSHARWTASAMLLGLALLLFADHLFPRGALPQESSPHAGADAETTFRQVRGAAAEEPSPGLSPEPTGVGSPMAGSANFEAKPPDRTSFKMGKEAGRGARNTGNPPIRQGAHLAASPQGESHGVPTRSIVPPSTPGTHLSEAGVKKPAVQCATSMVLLQDGEHCCWPEQRWDTAQKQCAGTPSCPPGYELPPAHLPIAGLPERCLRKPDWHPAGNFSLCDCRDERQSAYQCDLNDYAFTNLFKLTVEEIREARKSYHARGAALCQEKAARCKQEFETANGGTLCFCCMPD